MAKRTKKRTGKRRGPGRPKGTKSGARSSATSTGAMLAEARKQIDHVESLAQKRDGLANEIAALDAEIATALGGKRSPGRPAKAAPKRGRPAKATKKAAKKKTKRGPGRPKKKTTKKKAAKKSATRKKTSRGPRAGGPSLKTLLHGAMRAGTVYSLSDALDTAKKAGWKTTADNPKVVLNQALSDKTLFEKVARGQYRKIVIATAPAPAAAPVANDPAPQPAESVPGDAAEVADEGELETADTGLSQDQE